MVHFATINGPKEPIFDGMAYRVLLVTPDMNAKGIGGLVGVLLPGSRGVPYHYHKQRESVLVVLEGKAKAIVEGKEYDLIPGSVMFISPSEKHRVINVGQNNFKYVEFFTHPPIQSDFEIVST